MPNTSLRRPQKGYRGRGRGRSTYHGFSRTFASSGRTEATLADERWERTRMANTIDETMGFARFETSRRCEGWLVNVQPTSVPDERNPGGRAALDGYFIEEDGGTFKATVEYEPYFLIAVRRGYETEVEEWAKRVPGGGLVKTVRRVEKEDLSMPNHLLGYRRTLLELRFLNVSDLLAARRDIMPIAEKNRKNMNAMDAYAEVAAASGNVDFFDDDRRDDDRRYNTTIADASDYIVDIREYDVPYHVRVMIDLDIRVGKWYFVEAKHGVTSITCNEDHLALADPVVLAYDIETTKLPLKFPDAAIDQIMMISYMIDGQGFLLTNREIVSEDIADFEYTPRPEYPGPFMIFNERNEKALLDRFFLHIKEARPTVIATYNGDFFDWPFVEARASANGIDLYHEIGWKKDAEDQYKCNYSVHMDCFHWVNRDSYLPQGSRGLKAVTVAKLGYDPDELDPELMTPYAAERPQTLAEYSVSDAVATYYLYMKYVHPFIFSLCTILPLGPDDVLRKGTGTLCEMLLSVQAYQGRIALPNKHVSPKEAFWDGHLLDSETYVGGHVESIEAGVFRADIPVNFAIDPAAIDELLRDLDAALEFSITVEEKKSMDEVENYAEVREQVAGQLRGLRETPNRSERPLIYHLDVASMYPNIMTTNRLQPDSMIQESDCAACDFNRPGKTCDRRLPWAWRGEYLPAKRDEYNMIRHALENERFPARTANGPARTFADLGRDEQTALIRKRLQLFSQKVYHKIHDSTTIVREAIVCQRENPFYIDTVRDFRDRRYDYKGKAKSWKGKADGLRAAGAPAAEVEAAKKMIVLFDSLQLAHKVILNSFYGYVMRKGSRWYSMEMAGVTCYTGATIIQMARELVERIGRPLELDTDGIWCMLPASFPENFSFRLRGGKKLTVSYPCVMLNHLVHARFTNHQYQTLADAATFRYETSSDNSIFFEVDGPYRAMILPTSKEEDKNLKKRYAVFNHDGSLAELKGFELKRRGELKLIKIFQQQIFKFFLEGATLAECYHAVATVADRWLDVLHGRGATLADEELIDLISENRSMSKTLVEYGTQKSTSITTARRLADFLGEQMVKDKGLNCRFIICARPRNAPVTERAVPVAIFSAEEPIKRVYLRKWLLEDPPDTDPRALIDWEYYLDRLASVVQKLVTIPAALQKVRNPVPRVAHPDWLQRRINTHDDKLKQKKLTDLFPGGGGTAAKAPLEDITNVATRNGTGTGTEDMEDYGTRQLLKPKPVSAQVASSQQALKRKSPGPEEDDDDHASTAAAAAASVADPLAGLPKKMPDPSSDYVGFLTYQKQKWKLQKVARARRRQLFGDRRTGPAAQSNIRQTFMKQAHATFASTWQLLHLRPTDSPGVVAAFVLIDGRVHAVRVRVPRQVFVNFRGGELPDVDIAGCEVEQVNHTLPNGHPSSHLFRLTVAEDVYAAEADKFAQFFAHPSVEGVYERQVPPNVRAVLRLGNACTIDDAQVGVLGRGLEDGFDLGSLKRPAAATAKPPPRPYLEGAPLAYLYVSQIVAGDRQVFGVFSTTTDEAHVIVLQKKTRGGGGGGGDYPGQESLPNVGRIYAEMRERRAREARQAGEAKSTTSPPDNWQDSFRYQEKLTVRVTQVTTRRRAHLELGDVVKKLRKNEARPQVLVVQSTQRVLLTHEVPVLAEFPMLPLRTDPTDGSLPPLGWQAVAARRLVGHYLGLGSWIVHLTALARYGDVPLCNLERNDDPRFLIDVAYARRLTANRVVLWWSPGPRPDHGGHEHDDVAGPLEQAVRMPSVNNPGTFASVCVDIEVRNLAINTVLTSSLINELELGASTADGSAGPPGSNGGDDALTAEGAFAGAAVQVLREMVKGWWAEACRGSTMADVLVQHLVRWVEAPDSLLYDRALHRYVQTMSRKALQQLMADFRRVGAHVVFASPGRLMLQTTKAEVANAHAFAQYVVRSIKAKPLFHFIDLEISEYWDYLVWYDEYNYGGKACEPAAVAAGGADGGGGGGGGGEEGGQLQLSTIMHWQMATFLPERLRRFFSDWVVEFIELMHGLKRATTTTTTTTMTGSQNGSAGDRLTQLPNRLLQSSQAAVVAEDGSPATQVILGKTFEKPLRKAVAGLLAQAKREMLHPELAGDYTFPTLPGSRPDAATSRKKANGGRSSNSGGGGSGDGRTAVLELVKALMQVLSLDKNITLEARLLRKELLAMLDVREFSREGAFSNPSESLRLPGVSCESCTMARDFDFCRDEDLLPEGGTGTGADVRPWRCAFCSAEFDRNTVEERLVAGVEALAVEWATQDLQCMRCRALRLNEFAEHCTCSGEWTVVVDRAETERRIGVYGRVAAFYGLRMLGDAVEGVKQLM